MKTIESACESFKILLQEQLNRIANASDAKVDFANKETITIIGSGQLAESVLYWGLLTNVFDVMCENTYIAFGNFDKFVATHGDVETIVKEYGNDDEKSFHSLDIVYVLCFGGCLVAPSVGNMIQCGEQLLRIVECYKFKSGLLEIMESFEVA